MRAVSSSRVEIRGFLLRRCRLAISAASRIDGGGGESSVVSRFRRPDTDRNAGGWKCVVVRFVRLGEANVAGPLKVSTLRILPFEARRFSWKLVCCGQGVSHVWSTRLPRAAWEQGISLNQLAGIPLVPS